MIVATLKAWCVLFLCGGSLLACGPSWSSQEPDSSQESVEPSSQIPDSICPTFEKPTALGVTNDKKLKEISGIVPSHSHDGYWVHNDSGDQARIYGLTSTGARVHTISIESATAFDWEDLSRGPGPNENLDYLYIGDIGDNLHIRPFVTVYQVPEPTLSQKKSEAAVSIRLDYPKGAPDAEALLVHPTTGDLFIVSKAPKGEDAQLYVARAPLTETMTLEALGALPIQQQVTGGDFNASGNMVVLRTYNEAYFMKYTEKGFALFDETPCHFTLQKEYQGEAVSWASNDDGVVTLSEGKSPTLWYYSRSTP